MASAGSYPILARNPERARASAIFLADLLRTILIFLIAAAAAGALAGCESESEEAGLSVVATTPQVADLIRNVIGDAGEVTQILPANADPHDYEPRPSDAEALVDADLIVTSGGDVDGWVGQLVDSSGSDAPVLDLLAEVPARTEDGETDPHWWQDPANAIVAADAIAAAAAEADPAAAASIDTRRGDYVAELRRLDRTIAECLGAIPAGDRLLVTSHDSLGYFADRYGIEVVGAAIPALSTQAQPSAGETSELIDVIRSAGVGVIYPEAGVNADLETAIADGAGAELGPELWADTLGPEGTETGTYIGATEANASALAEGFSDGRIRCRFG